MTRMVGRLGVEGEGRGGGKQEGINRSDRRYMRFYASSKEISNPQYAPEKQNTEKNSSR
jgi:hypothetical protein